MVISPSVGRVVWFHQMTRDVFPGSHETVAAIIAYVHSDRRVNLVVFDANGNLHSRTGVTLVQPGDEPPSYQHCTWMPFQKGQAAKQEKPTDDALANRFRHHPPTGDQGVRYGRIRSAIEETARACVSLTPASPEQSRAIDKLDEAMFLFNAAIARNEVDAAA